MLVTIKLRLKDKHAAELNRQARAVNYVWNYCNEAQRYMVQNDRKWLTWHALQKLTAGSSKDLGLHAHTIQQVCQTYDRSRFRHRKPWLRFRGRKSLGWVPFNQGINGVTILSEKRLRFRMRVYETMHWRTLPAGAMVHASSFNCDTRGRWYVNLRITISDADQTPNARIGVDLGLKALATLSNGHQIGMQAFYRASESKLASVQRARKTKRMRMIHAKIANRRKDHLHKVSAQIAKQFGLIVIGDVSPSKLSQTNRAKSVHDAGWSDFKWMLSYKSIRNGGGTLVVHERLSTQLCSDCGAVGGPKGIAGLGIREWTCGGCGATHDRDVNAARNILARGLASLVEGAAKERSSQPGACLD